MSCAEAKAVGGTELDLAACAQEPIHTPGAIQPQGVLPVVNLEVLQFIRHEVEVRRIPVVMPTNSREEPDLERSYEQGVNAYVAKPVSFTDFVEAVRDLGGFWALLNEPPPGSVRMLR